MGRYVNIGKGIPYLHLWTRDQRVAYTYASNGLSSWRPPRAIEVANQVLEGTLAHLTTADNYFAGEAASDPDFEDGSREENHTTAPYVAGSANETSAVASAAIAVSGM